MMTLEIKNRKPDRKTKRYGGGRGMYLVTRAYGSKAGVQRVATDGDRTDSRAGRVPRRVLYPCAEEPGDTDSGCRRMRPTGGAPATEPRRSPETRPSSTSRITPPAGRPLEHGGELSHGAGNFLNGFCLNGGGNRHLTALVRRGLLFQCIGRTQSLLPHSLNV